MLRSNLPAATLSRFDGFQYKFREARVIAALRTFSRSRSHRFASNPAPINRKTRLPAKLADELSLRPAVSFAEWVCRVYLSQVETCAGGQLVASQTREITFLSQLAENARQCSFQKRSRTETVPSFRDIHSPEITRPTINILEQVTVNRLEMRDIKTARHSRCCEFNRRAAVAFASRAADVTGSRR